MAVYLFDDIPAELLAALLENPHESQILVDAQGVVRYLSGRNEKLYGKKRQDVIGSHILTLNPDSQMPRVLKTGRAEIGRVFRIRGKERIVSRIPLRDPEGNIVGAVGKLMFWRPEKVKEMARQVEVLENRLDYVERELRQIYSSRYSLERIAGETPRMRELKGLAQKASENDLAVLITGETGTGKDLFAHAIHHMSQRARGPFVRVNCAAIPHELFEAELFGYEAGAFTGAGRGGKPGKFELADGGSIFLDEVGDLPLNLQVKLLRVIQDREVERLGGTKPVASDFRLITATNRDMDELVGQGAFRQDLYYRLNTFHLKTAPLREIPEDIPRIAHAILAALRSKGDKLPKSIEAQALKLLSNHPWPGNVRQLKNALERAVALADGPKLSPADLPAEVREAMDKHAAATLPGGLKEGLACAEKELVQKALEKTGGNRAAAARLLNIHRSGLYQKMRRYGL